MSQVVLLDDFYADPQWVSGHARDQKYESAKVGGNTYHGLSAKTVPPWEHLEIMLKRKIQPVSSLYRWYKPGQPQETWIHADHGHSTYSAIITLDEEPHETSGTSFWKNNDTGSEFNFELDEDRLKYLRELGNHEAHWTNMGNFKGVFNQMVVYPSRMFHSRMSKEIVAERLVHAVFFNVL